MGEYLKVRALIHKTVILLGWPNKRAADKRAPTKERLHKRDEIKSARNSWLLSGKIPDIRAPDISARLKEKSLKSYVELFCRRLFCRSA